MKCSQSLALFNGFVQLYLQKVISLSVLVFVYKSPVDIWLVTQTAQIHHKYSQLCLV